MSSRKKLTLRSCDGQTFEIEESVETMFTNFRNMIEDKVNCASSSSAHTVLVPRIDGKTLGTVIERCKKHANSTKDDLERYNDDSELLEKEDEEEVLVPLFLQALLFSAMRLDVKELAAKVVGKLGAKKKEEEILLLEYNYLWDFE